MKHLRFLARAQQSVLPLCFLAFSSSLAGCGQYDSDAPDTSVGAATAAGGSSSTGGTGGGNAGSAGTATAGGTGGSAAGPGGGGMGSSVRPEPPEASCDNLTGCGGEVLGNWFAVDSCLTVGGMANLSALGIGCTEATASGTLEVTGNWTFADGPADNDELINDTTQTTGQILLGLGPACLNVSGTTVDCTDVAGPLASIGFESTTCVNSATIAGGCDCTGVVNQQGTAGFVTFDAGAMGLWSTEESSLTVAGFTTVNYDYCIEEDAFLHVSVASSSSSGVVTGTIVFQKQP
jgi:hypothetical protein